MWQEVIGSAAVRDFYKVTSETTAAEELRMKLGLGTARSTVGTEKGRTLNPREQLWGKAQRNRPSGPLTMHVSGAASLQYALAVPCRPTQKMHCWTFVLEITYFHIETCRNVCSSFIIIAQSWNLLIHPWDTNDHEFPQKYKKHVFSSWSVGAAPKAEWEKPC